MPKLQFLVVDAVRLDDCLDEAACEFLFCHMQTINAIVEDFRLAVDELGINYNRVPKNVSTTDTTANIATTVITFFISVPGLREEEAISNLMQMRVPCAAVSAFALEVASDSAPVC